MILRAVQGAFESFNILQTGLGATMQSLLNSAGLNSVSSWISASAASNRQIAGSTFLSQVAGIHGIAACATMRHSSRFACSAIACNAHGSHSAAGGSSCSSKLRSRTLVAAVSVSASSCLQHHTAHHAMVHTSACQPGKCRLSAPHGLVQQQRQRCACSCCGSRSSCQHTISGGYCRSSSRFLATTALGTGQAQSSLMAAQAGAASWSAGASSIMPNQSIAADGGWRSKRYAELTPDQKMQALMDKLTQKWETDPVALGVRFDPGLGVQRCTCPECHNGSSGDNSFAVTVKEDMVLWKCHRATCGFAGAVNLIGGPYADSDKALDAAANFSRAFSNSQGATAAANGAHDVVMKLQKQAEYRPAAGALGSRFYPLTQDALLWFKQRGISQATLERNGIMMEDKYCAHVDKVVPQIAFPYLKNGSIVNVKYRALGVKAFTQSKGGEQILYGYDEAKGADHLVIVEGEMDKLAVDEVLQLRSQDPDQPRVAVVSVPAGAPGPPSSSSGNHMEQKFRFVEACFDVLSSVGRVVLAVDADGPGVVLAEELSRRIGREKCWRVTWPTGPSDSLHPDAFEKAQELGSALANGLPPPFDASVWARKDANEVLVKDGPEVLKAYLDAAAPLRIIGLYTFGEFFQQVYDLYQQGPRGLSWGVSTGWESVDACYQVVPGELTIVTGLPNSGKSEWLDALAVNLARQNNWNFALCSLENTPKEHARKLMEKYTGKAFLNASYSVGTAKMELMELIDALVWIDSHFHIIRPPPDTMPSIDYILEKARAAVLRYGIQGLIIDPYNELDPRRPGSTSETEHVSRLLTKIKRFAQHYDCHVWFVAHPRTQRGLNIGGGTSSLPPPSMYDVSGSAHFINKADNGIVVHRPYSAAEVGQGDPYTVQLLIRKVRNKLAGKVGDVQLTYDRATGRYLDSMRQDN